MNGVCKFYVSKYVINQSNFLLPFWDGIQKVDSHLYPCVNCSFVFLLLLRILFTPKNTVIFLHETRMLLYKWLFYSASRKLQTSMKINDPLVFINNAIEWGAFAPSLKEVCHDDIDKRERANSI